MTSSRDKTIKLANEAGEVMSVSLTPKQLGFLQGYLSGVKAIEKKEADKDERLDKSSDNK